MSVEEKSRRFMRLMKIVEYSTQSDRKQHLGEEVGDGRFKYWVGGRRDCASEQHSTYFCLAKSLP